jgi:hypothetical protein
LSYSDFFREFFLGGRGVGVDEVGGVAVGGVGVSFSSSNKYLNIINIRII